MDFSYRMFTAVHGYTYEEALALSLCPTCGTTEPLEMPTKPPRYRPGRCACKKAQDKKEKQEQLRKEQEQQQIILRTTRLHTCYSWLGREWSDSDLETTTLATFDQKRQRAAYQTACAFVENLEGILILHGTYGTGKTHLLAGICHALITEKDKAALFTTAPNLFEAIQDCINCKLNYLDIVRRAINTPLLVIDDIDKAKKSDFREEIYFSIIDKRTKAGRPLAISTNRLSDLESFVGGASCSRLGIKQIAVGMIGEDYRTLL